MRRQGNSGERAYQLLKKKYDENGDGKVSRQEYPRGEATFQRLDRNQDGFLTLEDFGGGRRRNLAALRLQRQRVSLQAALGTYFEKAPRVDRKAWKRFLRDWDDNGDGVLEDLEAYELGLEPRTVRFLLLAFGKGPGPANSLERKSFSKAFDLLDVDKDQVLNPSEFRLPRRERTGPNPLHRGQEAPDFNLPLVHDEKSLVRLSSFAGKKPVALIFGSYT